MSETNRVSGGKDKLNNLKLRNKKVKKGSADDKNAKWITVHGKHIKVITD